LIRIEFDPELLPPGKRAEWDAWLQSAEDAARKAIEAWEDWKEKTPPAGKFQHEWEASVWSTLKNWLLKNVFHEKCAYCETPQVRAPLHADHFRPKGRVRFKVEGQSRLRTGRGVDAAGQTIDHPGYFWLAYEWRNLLPACALCNSGEGKKDQFPVEAASHVLLHKLEAQKLPELQAQPRSSKTWSGFYYLHPRDLDLLEVPLLLHPYRDDPRKHLIFGDKGIIAARDDSKKGQRSIEVYNLKDDTLRGERQKAQEEAENLFMIAYLAKKGASLEEKLQAADATLDDYRAGRKPYSAAVLDYIELLRSRLRPPAG